MKEKETIIASVERPTHKLYLTNLHVLEVNKLPSIWYRFWLRILCGIKFKKL